MNRSRASRLACLGVLSLAAVRAQAPAEPRFRVTTDLVQVDAVVTDSKGNHIRDLEAADFRILEDGKPRTITNFSWIAGSAGVRAVQVSGAAPGNPERQEISRSMVFLFDDSAPHAEEDLVAVVPSLRKLIAEQMGPRDLAAVTASRGGMGFYQQLTNDKQQLYLALERLQHRRGFGLWTVDIPEVLNPDTGKLEPAFALRHGEPGLGYRDPAHPPNPIAYLVWAIQGLEHVPGRKAVVLFTHSFAAPPQLIDLANRAGVVIHVVDPHGFSGVVPSDAPYRRLAQQTGGLFLRSAPGAGLERDLARVLEDANGYYLLGFRPNLDGRELAQGRVARHDIKVRVLRAGLEVRARNGYLGIPEKEARAAPKTSADDLLEAVSSPFRAGKIRLGLEPRYRASAPDPKTKRRSALLEVAMRVDGRDLRFVDREDGKKELVLSALVLVAGQDGAIAARDGKTFSFPLTAEQAAKMAEDGGRLALDVRLPGPGAYQVRAAIRDEATGDTGSAYALVDAPDFNQEQITLGSIELSSYPDRWDGSGEGADGFAAGTPLYFQCGLFGYRTASQPPHDGRVEVQVTLFREQDAGSDPESKVVPVPPSSLAAHTVGGQLDVRRLAPGEYVMRLVAWDRLAAGKRGMAVQWARFRIGK